MWTGTVSGFWNHKRQISYDNSFYLSENQLTFPLHHFTQVLLFKNGNFSRLKPESGVPHALALCQAPNLAYEKIKQNFTHSLQNEIFFKNYISLSDYKSATIWCNNQIQSSLTNLTDFARSQMITESRFHTGSKYHSKNYLVDENGMYTEYNDTLYIFQICKNDIFWSTNFHGTKYRYLCCVNYAQRLGLFLTLIRKYIWINQLKYFQYLCLYLFCSYHQR